MIEIKITQNVRNFKVGDNFKFENFPLVIVGDNGCGKTTLINLIRVALKKKGIWTSADTKNGLENKCEVVSDYDEILFFSKEDDPIFAVDAVGFVELGGMDVKNYSSGQRNSIFYFKLLEKAKKLKEQNKKILVVMDEMDTNFDKFNQILYAKTIHSLQKINVDVILVTHHLGTIMCFDKVFNLQVKQEIETEKYFENFKNYVEKVISEKK